MNFINKYNKISQLKKNVLTGTICSGVDILITMISYPIYLKYLSVEIYGLWTIVSVVLSFTQVGLLRIGTATVKYVAGEYWKKNFDEIAEYTTTSFYIVLIPSLIIICVLVFFKLQIAGFLGVKEEFLRDGVRLILFVGLLSVFTFFVDIIRSVVVGIGRLDITNMVFSFSRIFQIILSVSLLARGADIWGLYYGCLLYYLLPAIVFIFILKYIYHVKIFNPFGFKKQKMRDLINYGGALTIATVAQMLVVPFNKIIISKYVGLSEVAYYHIANRVVTAIRGLFVRGLEALLPKASEMQSKTFDSLKSLLTIHKKGMLFMLCSVFPVFLLIFIFANPILKIWLGKNFNIHIAVIVKILLIGWFFNILATPDYFIFMGIGKVYNSVMATCIKAISNVIIIFALLLLNIQLTLVKVVVIDSLCLLFAAIFLKYKYFQFRKARMFLK